MTAFRVRILLSITIILTCLCLGTDSPAGIHLLRHHNEMVSGNPPKCKMSATGLSICVENPVVRTEKGSKVTIHLTIKNTTSDTQFVDTTSGMSKYRLSLIDSEGTPILTARDLKMKYHLMTENDQKDVAASLFVSHRSIELAPGEAISEDLVVSDIYHLDAVGHYSLQLSHTVILPDGKATYLELDPIDIEIAARR